MLFPTLTIGLALFLFRRAVTLPLVLGYTARALWVLRRKMSGSVGYDEG